MIKSSQIRAVGLAALALSSFAAVSPAFADYVLNTASAGTAGSDGVYSAYGDGTDANSNFIAATFSLSQSTSALQVGANVDANGVGSVFAEVVAVSSLTSMPTVGTGTDALATWLKANSLGSALISAPTAAGDASTVINFSSAIAAGQYALVFGSGFFGTTGGTVFGSPIPGQINLTDTSNGNVTNGSPNIFASLGGDSFSAYQYDTGMRIFAAPVPVPAALPLFASGLVGLAALRRRRNGR